MKGQGFHWPEMHEAWLLSPTPVVLQHNPRGVLRVAASGKEGAASDPSLLQLWLFRLGVLGAQ